MHVCNKYKQYSSVGMGVINNFQNLNADFETSTRNLEVKVEVTGVSILACLERSWPLACVCKMLQVYPKGYRS